MNQCQQLTVARCPTCRLGCVTGGDKPKTPDSSTEADGADRINVFQQPDLCMVNGKFETVCLVGFDNVIDFEWYFG